MPDFAVAIPARYASERLPGKPLLLMSGKPMLQHVWERASASGADEVIVATDDERVAEAADAFGATVCLTAESHESGTDRIAEVAERLRWPDERVVVNLQGDEPLMPPALIAQCAALLDDGRADIGTLASPFRADETRDDPDVVKVIVDQADRALYFSRAAIPFSRAESTDRLAQTTALQHHGIYAYRAAVLRRLVATPPADIERCERLEQLRALFIGMTIRVGRPATRPGAGVDTPADFERVTRQLAEHGPGPASPREPGS